MSLTTCVISSTIPYFTSSAQWGDIVGEPGVVIKRDVILGYIQVAPLDSATAGNPGGFVAGGQVVELSQ
jgi:hypothetical protein